MSVDPRFVWPKDSPRSEAEHKLLAFVASLIVQLAHKHPRVTKQQAAFWIARIAIGESK